MFRVSLAVFLVLSLAGCTERTATPDPDVVSMDDTMAIDDAAPAEVTHFQTDQELLDAHTIADAVVRIEPISDQDVSGYMTFQQVAEGLLVTMHVTGLDQARHGFHIHENGSCEPGADGEPGGAAGGHFNPHGHDHGAPDDDPTRRHVGDFGNLEPDLNGVAHTSFVDPVATLSGDNSIIGRAVIVHSQEDDLVSQPTGDAGGRIGCGIIAARP